MKTRKKTHKKIPTPILDGIQKATGYSRKYISAVISGKRENLIISYYFKLAQEDFGKFREETGLDKIRKNK